MINPAAPDYLLKVIRCNCKSTCSTLSCTWMKHGIKCSLACGKIAKEFAALIHHNPMILKVLDLCENIIDNDAYIGDDSAQ